MTFVFFLPRVAPLFLLSFLAELPGVWSILVIDDRLPKNLVGVASSSESAASLRGAAFTGVASNSQASSSTAVAASNAACATQGVRENNQDSSER